MLRGSQSLRDQRLTGLVQEPILAAAQISDAELTASTSQLSVESKNDETDFVFCHRISTPF